MRKMLLFMMVSLDGYIEGEDHDLSWHNVDEEFNVFAAQQLQGADTIVFGRRTYQLMERFWPSKEGLGEDPVVARSMNETPKVVFSKSLDKVVETDIWRHVRLVKDHIKEEIEKLKKQDGKNIIVLGSNNFCVTLLTLGLLDEIRIMVNPVVIGKGTPLFEGVKQKFTFNLFDTKQFGNGNVLLSYKI